ncbi:MAG: crotonase/enoyl-CoA hydratase family protein [Sinobacteraceae bacterium]|nr:crotonase/enoyl-CoA hydratase family protein [Nevskiaceae bacterium]MCP5339841.1 crotonase/enoyl-CoA hydratase family protein [Nevskiaceae bacterium]MCP5359783.1 crotonase/enoyl-CoA hydratase family protein [Nevskiaceae bacterium]MCP5467420.1 crotonase/enoyl-CoA hydratase family protein [Nevskiaceae bacterium]MCP5472727.1 crotonase/enoyl-CoA hydratase family protein [Nevskiaceae bacterium]
MAEVEFEVRDGIGIITLNRPEARNAVNGAVAAALADITESLETRTDVRVAVLTGAGGNFCSGMDLKAFLRNEDVKPRGRGFAGLIRARIDKPLIAAIEGYALAGGFEIALACDLIVAATDARFGLPEVKRGLVANAGGLVRLPSQLPYRIAMELVLTGATVPAERLVALGLVNRVVAPGQALDEALRLAVEISSNGPLAVTTSKRVLRDSRDWPSTEAFDRQDAYTAPVFRSEDAREGARAFAEKRAPRWIGR